jgi:hypothetical protein
LDFFYPATGLENAVENFDLPAPEIEVDQLPGITEVFDLAAGEQQPDDRLLADWRVDLFGEYRMEAYRLELATAPFAPFAPFPVGRGAGSLRRP